MIGLHVHSCPSSLFEIKGQATPRSTKLHALNLYNYMQVGVTFVTAREGDGGGETWKEERRGIG